MGRPVRGLRESSFCSIDQTPSLASLNSAFQLQEYISLLIRLDPHNVNRIVALPGREHTQKPDEQQSIDDERLIVDEACWIYEQLRRLAQDLTHPLITTLQQECTRETCPEMKAGEWLYLCVAHGNSGGMEHCCAIDYIVHTIDSATALLNSPRAFPSRISIPPTSHRHFPSLARRLGRIFAHAYYHHRDAFESAEAEGALYSRFLALARVFNLVPAEFLVIPSRTADNESRDAAAPPRVILLGSEDSTASSPSPRIGGRARTGTMYLSGDFAGSVTNSAIPQRMPNPLTGNEFIEGVGVSNAGEDAPGKPRILARDFALPPESRETQVSDQVPSRGDAVGQNEAEKQMEQELTERSEGNTDVPEGETAETQVPSLSENETLHNPQGDALEEKSVKSIVEVESALPSTSADPVDHLVPDLHDPLKANDVATVDDENVAVEVEVENEVLPQVMQEGEVATGEHEVEGKSDS